MLPVWAAALLQRLDFLACRGGGEATGSLVALREGLAVAPADGRLLRRFLDACLALLVEEAARRPDLAAGRAELEALCGMARSALDGDCDDRPLLARQEALYGLPGRVAFAAPVPGRVVFLAAMAAEVPSEEGPAAVMLANDLAAVAPDLPLRALQAALRG